MVNAEIVPDIFTLPPPNVRLIKPGEMIETPIDKHGLIIIPQLLSAVRATIHPDFDWLDTPLNPSVHHVYHPENDYSRELIDGTFSEAKFRNLPPNKVRVPRVFENWLHEITIPAPKPSQKVMRYEVEAWNVAKDLFRVAREAIKSERQARDRREDVAARPHILKPEYEGQDINGEEFFQKVFDKIYWSLEEHSRRLNRIPPEFRLIHIGEEPEKFAPRLGRLVIHNSADFRSAVNYGVFT